MASSTTSFQINDGVLALATRLKNPIWIFDMDTKHVLWANEEALRVWAADSLEELCSRDMGKDMSEAVALRIDQYRQDFTSSDAFYSESWSLYPKGIPITLRVIHSGILLEDGRMALLCDGFEEQKADPETLRSAEALLHTPMMVTLYTQDGKALYRNPAARDDISHINETFQDGFVEPKDYQVLLDQLAEKGVARGVVLMRTKHGKRWHEVSLRSCKDAVTGDEALLLSEVDVSELKRAEARALHLASHDVLTELPNRKYVMEHFSYLLEEAKRKSHQAALMFIDLDAFKFINDSIGHAAGDALLIEVAKRIKANVNSSDMIARLSGDEFLVLTIEDQIEAHADQLSSRLLNAISAPCVIMGRRITSTPSIGIALFQKDGNDLNTLMKHADMAMYHAKKTGGGSIAYYQPEFGQSILSKKMEKNELKVALDNKEFTIYLQPRIDIRSDTIVGAEALARWIHPSQGLVPPDMFIPTCERVGLISELGLQIFELAAIQQRKYELRGTPITISVNISPLQLKDPYFIQRIQQVITHTQCTPEYLELEITESTLMDDDKQTIERLEQLRDLGLKLYIDDFGTGFANFRSLQRYPLAGLKVDRSFINAPLEQRALAAMIIMMSKAMGLRVIAEGVETEEQLIWLQTQDCDEFQGYFISPPVSISAFEDFISEPQMVVVNVNGANLA